MEISASRGDRTRVVFPRPVFPRPPKPGSFWASSWSGVGGPFEMIAPSPSQPKAVRGSLASDGCSSPSAIPSTSTSDDPTRPLQYAAATVLGRGSAEAARAQLQADLALMPVKLLQFLRTFKWNDAEACAFYPSLIGGLEQRGYANLTVNFRHLLRDRGNWELAFLICNHHEMSAEFLEQAAQRFFNGTSLQSASPKTGFSDMPRRIHMAKDFILSSERVQLVSLCGGQTTVPVATTHGRRALDVILSKVSWAHHGMEV